MFHRGDAQNHALPQNFCRWVFWRAYYYCGVVGIFNTLSYVATRCDMVLQGPARVLWGSTHH